MKKIILITAFLILIITPSFSQINRHFIIDTTIKSIYRNPYTLEKGKDLNGLLNKPFTRLNPKTTKSKSQGEMPCVIPEGYFPMKIVIPDSTQRFSLLIKQL